MLVHQVGSCNLTSGEQVFPSVDRLHELERMRRSIAMLQPKPMALSREDAMKLIAELQDLERRMRDLRQALRAVLDDQPS